MQPNAKRYLGKIAQILADICDGETSDETLHKISVLFDEYEAEGGDYDDPLQVTRRERSA